MPRDKRQLSRDILSLKNIYPNRLDDGFQRIFYDNNEGEFVCVNGVPIGVEGYTLGKMPVREINIMLRIPDDYPLTIPGETHDPLFGIPINLAFKGEDLRNAHVWPMGGDWEQNNWAWVCLLFPDKPVRRDLVASLNLLLSTLRIFARTGK